MEAAGNGPIVAVAASNRLFDRVLAPWLRNGISTYACHPPASRFVLPPKQVT